MTARDSEAEVPPGGWRVAVSEDVDTSRQIRCGQTASTGTVDPEPQGQPREADLVRLMDEYERPIYNYLLAIVRDREIALDCTQDTFLRAYQHLGQGKPVCLAWLYTVARNRARDEFRRGKRFEPDDTALALQRIEHATDTVLAVQAVLERLSPADRELLYLFDVAGFRTEEIASMLGVHGSAIRQRLSRARARFRDLYRSSR